MFEELEVFPLGYACLVFFVENIGAELVLKVDLFQVGLILHEGGLLNCVQLGAVVLSFHHGGYQLVDLHGLVY